MLFYKVVTLDEHLRWKLRSANIVHLLMVDKNLGRQALQNPDMFKCLIRSESLVRVPNKASLHKVSKVRILVTNDKTKWFPKRFAQLAS